VGLISVPAGRFAADASLSHRKHPLRSKGLRPTRCWSRRRYHRMWCF